MYVTFFVLLLRGMSILFHRSVFYVGGIFCAGLLVAADNPRLNGDGYDARSSPFVIALDTAGVKVVCIF